MSCWSSSGSGSRRERLASTCRSDRRASRAAISAGPPSCGTMPRRFSPATSSWRSRRRSGLLYVFVVIEHGTRRLAHVNVTAHPSADWTLQQLRAVVGEEGAHQYLIHDRDRSSPGILMNRSGRLGHRSVAIASGESESELDLRTRDRDDSERMSGLDDSAVGGTSALDFEIVGRTLQPR